MPPRTSRSLAAAATSDPTPTTPTPPSLTTESSRSNATLTPVPDIPDQAHSDRAQTDLEPSRIPEPRLASAAELERLNDIIADLQRRIKSLMPTQPPNMVPHTTFEREVPYRETSYASTTYTSAPHKPKIKASDLPRFRGGH
jgi:hypothetical protein